MSILYLFDLKRKLNKLWLEIKNVNFRFGILRDSKGSELSQQIITSKKLMKFRGANGIMLVFDVTNEESFKNLEYWLE